MNPNPNSSQLSEEQLLELVQQLIADNARLRAEIEELKRKNARTAAPFSKNKHQKNPERPGRKAGQGKFSHRTAPAEEQYSRPIEDVTVIPLYLPGLRRRSSGRGERDCHQYGNPACAQA